MTLSALSLPYVRAISPYQPGKPITELAREMGLAVDQIVKLASNENPLGMSPKARAAKEKATAAAKQDAWVWRTDQPMPSLQSAEGSR
jgi:histidinol-phosphate aminotransferase